MDIYFNDRLIRFLRNDITRQDTEALINAANTSLLGGGGVDGAIHREGGSAILEECKKISAEIGRCIPGRAVITTGGNLKAKFVIHTVGPIWYGGRCNEPEVLKNCYLSCMKLADEYSIKSISFPSISTGAYRYPIDKASDIAIKTVVENIMETNIKEIRFILFSNMDLEQYIEAYKKINEEALALVQDL